MNVIIFSKDRAAQLDLLLRSGLNWLYPTVIYTFSNLDFKDAYGCIKKPIYHQTNFKDNVIWAANSDAQYTMFLTDDDVFLRDFGREIYYMPDDIACLSLRLNPRMTYCYTLNRAQKIPPFVAYNHIEHTYTWEWRGADADYGYPMSLDGHIFRTADILPLLKKLDYTNPNELEGQLARHPINRPKMMCFDKSVIVNNPINRVQNTVPNRHGDITAEWLNEQFLQGKRIKLEPFLGYEPNACHVELPVIFE